ncbi:LuxR C-terminal-related transcriptional regulator [Kocuria sabuli]|uniref:LuxR C-terminal-related transcriptional regulator n=1 Tax=Kocuria sabuli TaxID=3071448 RepID=UPI0034D7A37D
MELHISTSTVEFHLAHLITKLAARNRVELTLWAYETKRARQLRTPNGTPHEGRSSSSAPGPSRRRPASASTCARR